MRVANKGFNRALCPIVPNITKNAYFLLVRSIDEKWKGGLSIAFSTQLPKSAKALPTCAAVGGRPTRTIEQNSERGQQVKKPDLREGTGWFFTRIQMKAELIIGACISFRVDVETTSPFLRYAVNSGPEISEPIDDPCLMDCLELEQNVWAFFDVYGVVTQVELLGALIVTSSFHNSIHL